MSDENPLHSQHWRCFSAPDYSVSLDPTYFKLTNISRIPLIPKLGAYHITCSCLPSPGWNPDVVGESKSKLTSRLPLVTFLKAVDSQWKLLD